MEDNIKNMLRIFLDSIRDYELSSGKAICHDERNSEDFVDNFIDSEDGFEYRKIIDILKPLSNG